MTMSREGDLLRKSLRRFVIPELVRLSFVGKTSSFQRTGLDFLDLLSVQYWKYGGEFILEFGRRERGDLLTSWGVLVPEAKIDVAYVNVLQRARLVRDTRAEGFRGFRFEGFGEDTSAYDSLAEYVATLLPQVDTWLNSREVGPNISPFCTEAL